MRPIHALGLSFALLLGACDKDEPKQPPATAEADKGAAEAAAAPTPEGAGEAPEAALAHVEITPQDPPTIEVLDAGAAQKQRLRYAPATGTSKMQMTMTMSMAMGAQPVKLPPIVASGSLTVDRIEDEQIHFTQTIDSMTVEAGPDTPAQVADAMRSQLAGFTGFRATAVMDTRGRLLRGSAEIPESLPPQLQQMLEQMTQNMAQIQAPLPEDPLGKGARWTAVSTLDQGGLKLEQTVTYELVEVNGNVLTLKLALAQKLLEKTFTPPGMPGTATVSRFASSGKGTSTLDLTKLVPKSQIDLSTDMALELDMAGQKQAQEIAMTMQMQVEPGA